tara:strand:- start:39155 stop:39691 length:537 start_codon:yes stop_codon:yes gene_type:complete
MLSLIKRYSLQVVFTLSLLLGLQLPNFLQQYELRLQGHFVEAEHQLAQFQSLAEKYFSGDLQALITKHKNSDDRVFRDEAVVIENTYQRAQYLQQKINNLNKPIWYRLGLLSQQINQPIFKETWVNYQANIILNQQAIIVGVSVAVLLMLLLEIIMFLIKSSFYTLSRHVKNKPNLKN